MWLIIIVILLGAVWNVKQEATTSGPEVFWLFLGPTQTPRSCLLHLLHLSPSLHPNQFMSSLCIYLYSRDTPPQQWPGPQVPPVPDLHWHSDLMWRGMLRGLHQSRFTVRGKNPPSVRWGWDSGNGGGRENWLPSLTSKWEKRLCFLRNNHLILVILVTWGASDKWFTRRLFSTYCRDGAHTTPRWAILSGNTLHSTGSYLGPCPCSLGPRGICILWLLTQNCQGPSTSLTSSPFLSHNPWMSLKGTASQVLTNECSANPRSSKCPLPWPCLALPCGTWQPAMLHQGTSAHSVVSPRSPQLL